MIDIARRFAAYIPVTLVRQLLHEGLPEPGQPRPLLAATLFSDISGFTKMSEELASDGPRGAEELNRVLLMTFTAMIDVIHEMGGAVSHFYGDAMSVYFPETGLGDAARRALACAQLMQKVMAASFDRIVTNRPVGKDPFFSLTIKIGVGYGRCQEMVVGDSNSTLEFVLTGTAVDEAAAAEKLAKAGQVVASARVMAQADLAFLCQESDFCVVVDKVPTVTPQPIIEWSAYDETALSYLVAASGAFIPAAIAKRLERGSQGEIAEHRPVTSMFVDFSFVGNVDDASDVETAVHGQHLHDYYLWASDIVARFGGQNARVNRILTGDKGNQLHIIFGAPVAPDAPEQAMRCAMTLVREKPDFIAMQRIGLAAGKVFAGPVGSTTRREYTVVGDIVNLSARLAQVCSENCVFTNSNTAARVDNWIEFEVLPPVFLKGKQEAISPYKPVSERSGLTQLQAYFSHWERPLVGRDAELDLLLGGMDAAVRGIGGVAAILGAVGVGKTHLLAEGIRYWLDEGGTGLVGVAQQHKSDVPYGPWLDIWRDFFNLRTDMSTAAQAEQVVAQTRALLPDVSDDVALWGEVLGLPISGQEQLLELSAEVKQSRFISLVRRCFFAFSDLTPLLIILEDAHWADQSSLALLDEITRSLDGHKIFFAATFRLADELSMDLLDRSSCVPILVADLSPAHARVLLAQLIGVSQLPQAVEQHLGLRDREGRDSPVSPLFLEESINMMIGTGVLTLDGQVHVHEERLQTLQIPDTIHGLLLARLDRLPPAGRDLLQVASVIGRQFALEPLHNIAFDVPEQNISSLLEELSSEDITRLVMSDPEWIYLFQHALTHEVAYESLPYARRQSLHQAMADWLVARYMDNLRSYYPILAYHYSQAGNHKAGLRYALAAGLDARALFSNHEALGFFNQAEKHLLAVGEAENWETAVTLYLARSEVFLHLGDFTRAIEDVEHSYRHAAAHDLYEQMAQANNKLAELKWRQTKYDEIAAFSSKVLEMRSQISSNEIARAYQLTGLADASLGHYESALENLHIAESLCLETQNRAQLARVLEIIGFVHYTRKELALALDAIKRSVALSRDASTPVNVASSLSNISLIHFRLGQVVSSLETINEAIQLVTAESQTFLTTFLLNRAEILCYLGEFQSARFDFDEVARHFTKADDHRGLLEFYLLQGFDYYAAQNKWEHARQMYVFAQEILEQYPNQFHEESSRWHIGLAQVELRNDNTAAAKTALFAAENLLEESNLIWWQPVVQYYLGELYLQEQDVVQAKIRFRNVLTLVKNGAMPDYQALSLLALATLELDEVARLHLLEQCVATVEERARAVVYTHCMREAGLLLAASDSEYHKDLGNRCLQKVG